MNVNGKFYHTIWMEGFDIYMIDQNKIPFSFDIIKTTNYLQTCVAIKDMNVRGAGAIGACAGFAMAQASCNAPTDDVGYHKFIEKARRDIEATRPTARNLFYATEMVYDSALDSPKKAVEMAQMLALQDIEAMKQIGQHGNQLIRDGMNIETHCNAGWLAFVNYGSALSPIYVASQEGKKVHVWVDETRPRNQGARLTAWELLNEKISCTVIPDNAGALLMSQGKVDMMIVGADRIALNGDVANKIGTFEKAIVAKEFGIPFYVAAPLSTFDANCSSGAGITIENRNQDEVLRMSGVTPQGDICDVAVAAPGSTAFNPAFDVTPARYITGIITEKGIITPNEASITEILKS